MSTEERVTLRQALVNTERHMLHLDDQFKAEELNAAEYWEQTKEAELQYSQHLMLLSELEDEE